MKKFKKVKRVLKEQDENLHFDAAAKLDETDDVELKTEEDEDPVAESDKEEVKAESDEEELVSEEDEELKAESDEEELVSEEDEEEVKAESDEEEVKAESDEEEVKAESEELEEEDDVKLSEELGDLKLEQEVKDKIDAAFDAIVKEKVAKIKEQLEAEAEEEIKESIAKLQESVGLYVEKVARTFVSQNRIALKESLRLKYFESFFGKVRRLFKENYVDLPEAEEELAKELKAENEELKDKADEVVKENKKLAESIVRLTRQHAIEKVASEMFLTESERFKNASKKLLSEKLSDKRFEEKLKAISELFSTKASTVTKKKLLSEGKIDKKPVVQRKQSVHPDVAAIMDGF